MSPGQQKGLAGCLVVGVCFFVVSAKLLSSFYGRLQVCGASLTPKEIAEIKRAAHEGIFAARTNARPAWIPVPLQKCVSTPILRLISDSWHPIDIIQVVNRTNRVIVWYRGPEVKAYVKGKEVGWFQRGLSIDRIPGGWTNCSSVLRFP